MAINLIPAEFNDRPDVMNAWRTYHQQGRERVDPSQEIDHQERVTVAQSGMIFSVMRALPEIAATIKKHGEPPKPS
jgi:hypothetical protein